MTPIEIHMPFIASAPAQVVIGVVALIAAIRGVAVLVKKVPFF